MTIEELENGDFFILTNISEAASKEYIYLKLDCSDRSNVQQICTPRGTFQRMCIPNHYQCEKVDMLFICSLPDRTVVKDSRNNTIGTIEREV